MVGTNCPQSRPPAPPTARARRNGWWRWRPHINEGILSMVERHKPVVAAHRGGGYPFGPENTLYSYRRSVYECGAHILEIDVRLTKDKQLVLVHDAHLDRTTNGQGLVGEYTLEELKKLDARAKFRKRNTPIQPLTDGSMDDPRLFQIPTLEEVFDEFAGCADVTFFLDMKDTGAVAQTIELIKERKLENRIIFGSVAPGPNQAVRRLKPEGIPVGPDVVSVLFMNLLSRLRLFWLYPHKHEVVGIIHSASLSAFIPPRGIKGKLLGLAEYVLLGGGGRLVNERLVRDVRHSGRMFAVFGVEMSDPVLIRECLDMGVEIIFSDSPDIARDTINKWKRERQPSQSRRLPTSCGVMEGTAGGGGGTCGGEGERLSDQQKLQVLRREFLKLREEHTQLQSQLAEFSKLKAKVRLLGLIQEDRRVLTEELVASNEKIAELVHENELLKESNNELSIENKKMKEQALKLNQYLDSAVDDLKQSTVRASRSLQANENDQLYQKRFCLPDTEPLIASYSCFDSKMRGGKLYLSPNYLCFGTHFSRILGDGDTIIRLKDVRHVRKEKIFQLGKGGGKSLHFVLSDTEVVLFRGFVNRDKALDNILEQAKRFGATLLDN